MQDNFPSQEVWIYRTTLEPKLKPHSWEKLLAQVPIPLHTKILSYRKWEDRQRSLFGKLILQKLLKAFDSSLSLEMLQYSKLERPYLPGPLDFNISHSGSYVVCAAVRNSRIGIDVEMKADYDSDSFYLTMSPAQIQKIESSSNPHLEFLRFWTVKESVAKAMGTGLTTPFPQLQTDFETLFFQDKIWYLREIEFDESHVGYISTEFPFPKVKIIDVSFLEG